MQRDFGGWKTPTFSLIENVIKSGWFKVEEGVIAGKQFVLYRNPTYIGSSPLWSCEEAFC